VLTDSAALHARAWGMVFDEFLLRLSDKTGWHFIPFDRDEDYHRWIEGRTRLDGVHAFLESRGIRVPAGAAGDPRDDDTAHALATRKGELVARELRERGVTATAGARRYLEAAGRAGLQRSVISASASTGRMLGYAGLSDVVDDRIDADVIRCERLMSPPAPDVPLAACRRLGVPPGEVVLLTHSAGGAAAGRAAGVSVVGVSDSAHAGRLGVEHVVPSLASLLDGRLAAASGGPVRR
jgi:beta-phosphoglucomutase-like phosphatase (HAD superfamily)